MQKSHFILFTVFTAILLIGGTLYFLLPAPEPEPEPVATEPEPAIEELPTFTESTIGASVLGNPITATTFGTGEAHLLFVGGIHGGYEWNSSLLAYEYIEYLKANPAQVPEDLSVSIIPVLNPDGLLEAVATSTPFTLADVFDTSERDTTGRFNANNIDLNRNFDCRWEPESSWRGEVYSAGTAAFSEPEAAALRDFVQKTNPKAVVMWHSIGGAVFTSECGEGVSPATETLMQTYAAAANYDAAGLWTAYQVTGDAEGWLASIGIPAVTVELEVFNDSEWERNLAGIEAMLQLYSSIK